MKIADLSENTVSGGTAMPNYRERAVAANKLLTDFRSTHAPLKTELGRDDETSNTRRITLAYQNPIHPINITFARVSNSPSGDVMLSSQHRGEVIHGIYSRDDATELYNQLIAQGFKKPGTY